MPIFRGCRFSGDADFLAHGGLMQARAYRDEILTAAADTCRGRSVKEGEQRRWAKFGGGGEKP
jgi:hypothetical protein